MNKHENQSEKAIPQQLGLFVPVVCNTITSGYTNTAAFICIHIKKGYGEQILDRLKGSL